MHFSCVCLFYVVGQWLLRHASLNTVVPLSIKINLTDYWDGQAGFILQLNYDEFLVPAFNALVGSLLYKSECWISISLFAWLSSDHLAEFEIELWSGQDDVYSHFSEAGSTGVFQNASVCYWTDIKLIRPIVAQHHLTNHLCLTNHHKRHVVF